MSGSSSRDRLSRAVASALGIKIVYRDDPVTRGESMFSVGTAETISYLEPEPRTADWLAEHVPSPRAVGLYVYNLFPFLRWISRYNLQWFTGDLVAGKQWIGCESASARWMCFAFNTMCCIRYRCHCRGGCRAAGDGIRQAGLAARTIRPLLVLHGGVAVLVLCNLKGYLYRGR